MTRQPGDLPYGLSCCPSEGREDTHKLLFLHVYFIPHLPVRFLFNLRKMTWIYINSSQKGCASVSDGGTV